MSTIVLDPGHGGHQAIGKSTPFGRYGAGGLVEKDLTLQLCRRVAQRLDQAVLTRTDDHNLSLADRIAVAQRYGAQAFVSVHASGNATPGSGPQVWIHPDADGGSARFAGALADALASSPGQNVPVRHGELAVLSPERFGGTAACLVEIHDPGDAQTAQWLLSGGMDQLADQLARGIREFARDGQYGSPYRYAAQQPTKEEQKIIDAGGQINFNSSSADAPTKKELQERAKNMEAARKKVEAGKLKTVEATKKFLTKNWKQFAKQSWIGAGLFEENPGPILNAGPIPTLNMHENMFQRYFESKEVGKSIAAEMFQYMESQKVMDFGLLAVPELVVPKTQGQATGILPVPLAPQNSLKIHKKELPPRPAASNIISTYFCPYKVDAIRDADNDMGWVDIPKVPAAHEPVIAMTGAMNGCHLVVTESPDDQNKYRFYHYQSPEQDKPKHTYLPLGIHPKATIGKQFQRPPLLWVTDYDYLKNPDAGSVFIFMWYNRKLGNNAENLPPRGWYAMSQGYVVEQKFDTKKRSARVVRQYKKVSTKIWRVASNPINLNNVTWQ